MADRALKGLFRRSAIANVDGERGGSGPATRTPAPASARTIAAPMPRAPPVTIARRPLRSNTLAIRLTPADCSNFHKRLECSTHSHARLIDFVCLRSKSIIGSAK
jgi:hypothetical protein